MNTLLAMLLQATSSPPPVPRGFWQRFMDVIDTPLPYSPFSEYLVVLFGLWALARYDRARLNRKRSFERQAQDVLEEKFEQGELSKKAFDKFRQDVSMSVPPGE